MSWGDAAEQAAAMQERLRARVEAQRERERADKEPLEEGRQALLAVAPMVFQAYALLRPSWPQDPSDYSYDRTTPKPTLYSAFLLDEMNPGPWPYAPRTRGLDFNHGSDIVRVYERFSGDDTSTVIAELRGPTSVEVLTASSERGHLIMRNQAAKDAVDWIPVDLARTLGMYGIPLPA